MKLDVAIIGAGPAGLTAGIFVRRASLKVACFEKLAFGGQAALTPAIDNFPAYPTTDGFTLMQNLLNQAQNLGVKIEYAAVNKLSKTKSGFVLETSAGKIEAKKVIIACGCKIRRLGLDNEEKLTGHGISYCASCDGSFFKNKVVAVVGGGNSAIADVEYLKNIAKKIYLINRRDVFCAGEFQLNKVKGYKNVEIITPATISKFCENGGTLTGIDINHNGHAKHINLDGVFLAIGAYPEINFLDFEINKDSSGYIIVDNNMQTSVKNLYACGDIISKNFRQIINACAEGATAGNSCIYSEN